MNPHIPTIDTDANSTTRMLEVLKPLQQESAPAEYLYQMKALVDWASRLRDIESSYSEMYARAEALKKEIESHKNH
jgi:hypothetical protein